jgi:hypothetical protein
VHFKRHFEERVVLRSTTSEGGSDEAIQLHFGAMDCFAEPVIGKNWPDVKLKPGNSASLRAYLSPGRHAASLALVAGNGANTPRLRQWGIAKIFRFAPDPNQIHDSRRLVPLEGRIAIVTDAGRDAMAAAAPARTK